MIPGSLEYRGEKIKLKHFYFDYDNYKNDADNIDASETARVRQLVAGAPIAHAFANRREAAAAVVDIKFPGYAAGGFNDGKQNSNLLGLMIEIPRANEGRYFLFKKKDAGYILIDDFIDGTIPGINHVEEKDGTLIYSMDGRPEKLVRTSGATN